MFHEIDGWQDGGHATIDVTNYCNLRCTYCYESDPNYGPYITIKESLAEKIVTELKSVGIRSALLVGDGEVTTYKNWHKLASNLLENGIGYSFVTNLSLNFDDEKIDCLARAAQLYVSFDTYNPNLHSLIRRRSDLNVVLSNLNKIILKSNEIGVRPNLCHNVVVSDRNIDQLPEIVKKSNEFGFNQVSLLYMIKLGDWPGADDQISLEHLKGAERISAQNKLNEARKIAAELSITLNVSGHFARVFDAPEQTSTDQRLPNAHSHRPNFETRACVSPWRAVFVRRTGEVGPCCLIQSGWGNLSLQPLKEIVASETAVAMRRALLEGAKCVSDLDGPVKACANCGIYPVNLVDELKTLIGPTA